LAEVVDTLALYRAKTSGKNRVELFWGDESKGIS
jgi:hypothetical protein